MLREMRPARHPVGRRFDAEGRMTGGRWHPAVDVDNSPLP
ncbi:hypothetical protein ASZ90_000342 [hydrocarbon metagenome]|uniref:Uncharacterized protein n=1 Tax=hydrocarbon metagenome TaxID=938273 RepID=A0A0W8G9E4_9ZZZZ